MKYGVINPSENKNGYNNHNLAFLFKMNIEKEQKYIKKIMHYPIGKKIV
jgi:hypothetical protein